MALRIIAMTERKMPRSKVGKFTGLDDIKELLATLNTLAAGKAAELTLDPALIATLKKDGTDDPARSIVNMLKRKFTIGGLDFKAYASDEKTITVIRPPAKEPKGKK